MENLHRYGVFRYMSGRQYAEIGKQGPVLGNLTIEVYFVSDLK